jgi:hypothetical protein
MRGRTICIAAMELEIKTAILSLLITLVYSLIGCAGARPDADLHGTAPVGSFPASADSGKYPPQQAEILLPSTVEAPFFWVPAPLLDSHAINLPAFATISRNDSISTTQIIEGYRVQIYAGREAATAHRIKSEALGICPLPTYLIYEAPQYKVRVGNFINREDASSWCDSLRHHGIGDAWVIKTTVNVNR